MSGIFDQVINYAPPSLLKGTVTYKGTWSAATNTPTLINPPDSTTNGHYYVVSAAGTQFSLVFNIGDWIISNGSAWEKVDNTDAVSSVFGRTGAVVGVSTDYSSVGITATAVGASSPSTGAFTTLSSTSTTTLNSTTIPASKTLVVTTDKISVLAATTSAELAGVISDETGSGSLVFATLPTFGATGVKLSGSTSGTTTVLSGATAGTSVLTLPVATDTLVGKATTDTLTNKTLTSPTITTPVIAQINDASGNETLKLASIASAVNEVTIENAATGSAVHISATGGDASVGLHLAGKGASGYVNVQDSTDATKRIMFNAAGGTTNTRTMLSSTQTVDRTLSLPDATDTLVGKATTDTLTNKTLTSPTLTAPILGTPASGNLASCTGYVGTSALVTVGALNSGSITTGFGAIDVGADAISGGAISGTTGTFSGAVGIGGVAAGSDAKLQVQGGNATTGIISRLTAASSGANAKIHYTDGFTYNWTAGTTNDAFTISRGEFQVTAGTIVGTFTSTGLNSTAIGATTPSTGAFTTLNSTSGLNVAGTPVNGTTGINLESGVASSAYLFRTYNRTSAGYAPVNHYASTWTFSDDGGGTSRVVMSSTGLAVTGTLSSTGNISTTGGDVLIRGAAGGQITQNSGPGGLYIANTGTSTSMRLLVTNGAAASVTALTLAADSGAATFASNVAITGTLSASNTFSTFNNSTQELWRSVWDGGNTGGISSPSGRGLYLTTSGTASTQGVFIDGSGKVGIGTTSPSGKLTVVCATTPILSTFTSTLGGYDSYSTDDASGARFFACFNSTGSVIGSISRVTTTNAVAFNTTSDGRLKENLREFTDSGRLIDALKPRVFDWKNSDDNGKGVIGFIAQEEHAADPIFAHIGAVSVGDDDPDTITKQWQRSDAALIPILVAELQSLRKRLAVLESK